MAWTAHKSDEDVKENFDRKDVLEKKMDMLTTYIKQAKHFIVFTGGKSICFILHF